MDTLDPLSYHDGLQRIDGFGVGRFDDGKELRIKDLHKNQCIQPPARDWEVVSHRQRLTANKPAALPRSKPSRPPKFIALLPGVGISEVLDNDDSSSDEIQAWWFSSRELPNVDRQRSLFPETKTRQTSFKDLPSSEHGPPHQSSVKLPETGKEDAVMVEKEGPGSQKSPATGSVTFRNAFSWETPCEVIPKLSLAGGEENFKDIEGKVEVEKVELNSKDSPPTTERHTCKRSLSDVVTSFNKKLCLDRHLSATLWSKSDTTHDEVSREDEERKAGPDKAGAEEETLKPRKAEIIPSFAKALCYERRHVKTTAKLPGTDIAEPTKESIGGGGEHPAAGPSELPTSVHLHSKCVSAEFIPGYEKNFFWDESLPQKTNVTLLGTTLEENEAFKQVEVQAQKPNVRILGTALEESEAFKQVEVQAQKSSVSLLGTELEESEAFKQVEVQAGDDRKDRCPSSDSTDAEQQKKVVVPGTELVPWKFAAFVPGFQKELDWDEAAHPSGFPVDPLWEQAEMMPSFHKDLCWYKRRPEKLLARLTKVTHESQNHKNKAEEQASLIPSRNFSDAEQQISKYLEAGSEGEHLKSRGEDSSQSLEEEDVHSDKQLHWPPEHFRANSFFSSKRVSKPREKCQRKLKLNLPQVTEEEGEQLEDVVGMNASFLDVPVRMSVDEPSQCEDSSVAIAADKTGCFSDVEISLREKESEVGKPTNLEDEEAALCSPPLPAAVANVRPGAKLRRSINMSPAYAAACNLPNPRPRQAAAITEYSKQMDSGNSTESEPIVRWTRPRSRFNGGRHAGIRERARYGVIENEDSDQDGQISSPDWKGAPIVMESPSPGKMSPPIGMESPSGSPKRQSPPVAMKTPPSPRRTSPPVNMKLLSREMKNSPIAIKGSLARMSRPIVKESPSESSKRWGTISGLWSQSPDRESPPIVRKSKTQERKTPNAEKKHMTANITAGHKKRMYAGTKTTTSHPTAAKTKVTHDMRAANMGATVDMVAVAQKSRTADAQGMTCHTNTLHGILKSRTPDKEATKSRTYNSKANAQHRAPFNQLRLANRRTPVRNLRSGYYSSDDVGSDGEAEVDGGSGGFCPSFAVRMIHSNVRTCFAMRIPASFSVRYLPDNDAHIVLEDSDGFKWETNFLYNKGCLSAGWRKFALDHGLELGDMARFDLIKPLRLKVQIQKASKGMEVSIPPPYDMRSQVHMSKVQNRTVKPQLLAGPVSSGMKRGNTWAPERKRQSKRCHLVPTPVWKQPIKAANRREQMVSWRESDEDDEDDDDMVYVSNLELLEEDPGEQYGVDSKPVYGTEHSPHEEEYDSEDKVLSDSEQSQGKEQYESVSKGPSHTEQTQEENYISDNKVPSQSEQSRDEELYESDSKAPSSSAESQDDEAESGYKYSHSRPYLNYTANVPWGQHSQAIAEKAVWSKKKITKPKHGVDMQMAVVVVDKDANNQNNFIHKIMPIAAKSPLSSRVEQPDSDRLNSRRPALSRRRMKVDSSTDDYTGADQTGGDSEYEKSDINNSDSDVDIIGCDVDITGSGSPLSQIDPYSDILTDKDVHHEDLIFKPVARRKFRTIKSRYISEATSPRKISQDEGEKSAHSEDGRKSTRPGFVEDNNNDVNKNSTAERKEEGDYSNSKKNNTNNNDEDNGEERNMRHHDAEVKDTEFTASQRSLQQRNGKNELAAGRDDELNEQKRPPSKNQSEVPPSGKLVAGTSNEDKETHNPPSPASEQISTQISDKFPQVPPGKTANLYKTDPCVVGGETACCNQSEALGVRPATNKSDEAKFTSETNQHDRGELESQVQSTIELGNTENEGNWFPVNDGTWELTTSEQGVYTIISKQMQQPGVQVQPDAEDIPKAMKQEKPHHNISLTSMKQEKSIKEHPAAEGLGTLQDPRVRSSSPCMNEESSPKDTYNPAYFPDCQHQKSLKVEPDSNSDQCIPHTPVPMRARLSSRLSSRNPRSRVWKQDRRSQQRMHEEVAHNHSTGRFRTI